MNPTQENTAQELIESFINFSKSMPFATQSLVESNNRFLKEELKWFNIKLASYNYMYLLYKQELKNCSFIWNWYWRKKLYKTIIAYRKYNKGKLYIESILNN